MKIAEIMTRNVRVVSPDRTIQEAARLMDEMNVGVLPVCDGRRLRGMVTDRDIVIRGLANGGDARSMHARDVMSPKILYCTEDQSVEEVLRNMGEQQVRRFPVVNREKRLVGIVSLGDISRNGQDAAEQALELRPTQDAIEFDTPQSDEIGRCRLDAESQGGAAGWVVRGPSGLVLRRFLDTNGDNKLDQWCYYKNGRYQEAREAIRSALSQNTPEAAFHFHAGMIYARLKDRRAAQLNLHRALSLNPDFSPVDAPVAARMLSDLGGARTARAER